MVSDAGDWRLSRDKARTPPLMNQKSPCVVTRASHYLLDLD